MRERTPDRLPGARPGLGNGKVCPLLRALQHGSQGVCRARTHLPQCAAACVRSAHSSYKLFRITRLFLMHVAAGCTTAGSLSAWC